jgi:hypothetical protein
MMNLILQFTNGIRYVPNLIVFFSTDHIGIIDHPYFNRERTKIFLGNPSYRGRKEWIQRNKSKGVMLLNEETENTVAKMTINFSHNAMNQLFKNLEHNLICEGKINFKIDLEYAKKFILEICSTEKISFGKYFLPNLISSKHLLEISKIDLKKVQEIFTGRITIDLYSHLQMEMLRLKEITTGKLEKKFTNFFNISDFQEFSQIMHKGLINDYILSQYQEMLKSQPQIKFKSKYMIACTFSKENILSSLIEFARLNNFRALHFVDSQTFQNENKFSQEDQLRYICKIHQECEEYTSSMIIYDLDSIVEISNSKPDSKNKDPYEECFENIFGKESHQIGNQKLFFTILELYTRSILMKTWIVLIVKKPFLKRIVDLNYFNFLNKSF